MDSHRGCRGAARDLWRAERALGEEAAEPVRQALPRFHRALAVSRHRLSRSVGPLRRVAKGRCAGLCPGDRRRDLLIPDRLGNNRVDTIGEPAGAARRRADLFRARAQRDFARQRPRAHHHRSALLEPLAVNGKVPRSGILVDRRGSLFPLRQGADPLRFVEPGKAASALRIPLARPHPRRPDRRHIVSRSRSGHGRELQDPPLLTRSILSWKS